MGFQIGGNVLDFLVLAVLRNGDQYGYSLTQKAQELLDVSESAIYPALRRLKKQEYLSTYDMPYQGRNRRYYKITLLGEEALLEHIRSWERYKMDMDNLLQGGSI